MTTSAALAKLSRELMALQRHALVRTSDYDAWGSLKHYATMKADPSGAYIDYNQMMAALVRAAYDDVEPA